MTTNWKNKDLRFIRAARTPSSELWIVFTTGVDDAIATLSCHLGDDPHDCIIHCTYFYDEADTEPTRKEQDGFRDTVMGTLFGRWHVSQWYNTFGQPGEVVVDAPEPKAKAKRLGTVGNPHVQ